MITYKKLTWSNCFSYGKNNSIDFTANSITQLVGSNGNGKSSIALILEEVLFNKNSKGIKKAGILNRFSSDKSYSIELQFDKDGTEYSVKTSRGSTQKISLYRDGVDISSHTATQTLEQLEGIIGYDHKIFSQIVYQNSASSLEFLTATDTARKRFLIELLDLGIYTKASDIIKFKLTELNKQLLILNTQITQLESWLNKYSKNKLDYINLKEELPPLVVEAEKLTILNIKLRDLDSENKKIAQNIKYGELLSQVKLIELPDQKYSESELDIAKAQVSKTKTLISKTEADINKLLGVKTKCPTCGSTLPHNHSNIPEQIQEYRAALVDLKNNLVDEEMTVSRLLNLKQIYLDAEKAQSEYENYYRLYKPEMPKEILNKVSLETEVTLLNSAINKRNLDIQEIVKYNQKASANNAEVAVIKEQIESTTKELLNLKLKLNELCREITVYDVLAKAFSTTGLVAYKIECLVKGLEGLTNEYLLELSDGRFQLSFEIAQSDKLNVVITDNDQDIDITALSNGERARVNVATLLAIRKLMQSLSNTRSNLLILDETMEHLDPYGKEKLVEILLNEESLNTILISHSFTHPLIERVSIVKENNMSRIECA
jgi:DNA repair exonuclease SbcCD ATPase subunit